MPKIAYLKKIFAVCIALGGSLGVAAEMPNVEVISSDWQNADESLQTNVFIDNAEPNAFAYFGSAMALSGQTAAIVSRTPDSRSVIDIFSQTADKRWQRQTRLTDSSVAINRNVDNHFASTLSLSGNTLAVGIPIQGRLRFSPHGGAVQIFQKNTQNTWFEQALIRPDDLDTSVDIFGENIVLRDKYLAVERFSFTNSRRAVYVYQRQGENWQEITQLQANDESVTRFGDHVAMTDNWLAISAFRGADTTAENLIYLYQRQADGQWQPQQSLAVTASLQGLWKGEINNLAMSGNRIAYGTNDGRFQVLESDDDWQNHTKVEVSPDTASGFDVLDSAMALDGDTLLIGSPKNRRVFVFQRYDDGVIPTWVQHHEVVYPQTERVIQGTTNGSEPIEAYFGATLALDGENMLIGVMGQGGELNWNNTAPRNSGTVLSLNYQAGQPTTTVASQPLQINGVWYDPRFNGLGFDFLQTDNGLVVTYYGYKGRQSGVPQWLISDVNSNAVNTGKTLAFDLYEGYEGNGGNLLQKPTTGNGTRLWGKMGLHLIDCRTAIATLNGKDGTKTFRLQKLASVKGVGCQQTAVSDSFAVSGSWYDPTYNGSGFVMTEATNGLVVTFYGYQRIVGKWEGCGFTGCTQEYVTTPANGQVNWLLTDLISTNSIEQGKTYSTTLYTPGAYGGSFTAAPTQNSGIGTWGTLSLTFDSCNSARATMTESYTNPQTKAVSYHSITQNLVRLATPAGLTCKSH